jgi:hypothetical protein
LGFGVKQFKITRINTGVFEMNRITSKGDFFDFVQRISFLSQKSSPAEHRQQNKAIFQHKYFNSKASKVVFIIEKW